jgi:magnesium chelatase subunit D
MNQDTAQAHSAVSAQSQAWADAMGALRALQVDGTLLGGVWLRARHGPVREAWQQACLQAAPKAMRVPISADDTALLGGIDLGATLQSSRMQWQTGLLAQADGAWLVMPMAERAPRGLLSRLTQTMDRQQVSDAQGHTQPSRFALMALDESDPGEGALHPSVADRVAFWLSIDDVPLSLAQAQSQVPLTPAQIKAAQAILRQFKPQPDALQALLQVAASLGIDDVRSTRFAWRLACVNAALRGAHAVDEDDLTQAIRCVLVPRAKRWPTSASEPPPDAAPPEPNPNDAPEGDPTEPPEAQGPSDLPPPEMLLAASLASLPADVLDRLVWQAQAPRASAAQGHSGELRRNHQRGRPLPSRAGRPGDQARLDVLATLRHAAPRQRLRAPAVAASAVRQPRVLLRGEDFHTKRYQQNSPTCLILALDASGSAAIHRLAQAKGAVELLLAQSYARRDSVCVIGFRGARAECLLPPTRSLVRAKRALAGLPGGGGTPLASALQLALEQARQLSREGQTPLLVVLSDGRANVTLAGLGGRQQAQTEAEAMARRWAQSGHAALWIDTATQPEPLAQALAQAMQGRYLPMPHVQSQRLASAMSLERQAMAR